MHLEAGWMGIATARGLTDAARERAKAAVTLDVAGKINWDGWTPGNPDLVETLLGEGGFDYPNFQAFLEDANVTIRGVADTRLNDLGSILAQSAEAGLSMDDTAKLIQQKFFTDRAWAEMVARTEIRRASTQSALGYYNDSGIEQKEWLVAWDEACEICQEAADMGPIPLDADFGEAGDGPPGHPNCLCVILPVVPVGDVSLPDVGDEEPGIMSEDDVEKMVKAPRAAVNNALAMLANLPTATVRDGKELIASPWPIVTRPTLDPDVWIDSTVEDVSIEDLYATQQFLNRERVAQFVENPGAIENGRRALANVYDNGRMLIVDGHHRLAAYWLLGANRANVWYLRET